MTDEQMTGTDWIEQTDRIPKRMRIDPTDASEGGPMRIQMPADHPFDCSIAIKTNGYDRDWLVLVTHREDCPVVEQERMEITPEHAAKLMMLLQEYILMRQSHPLPKGRSQESRQTRQKRL